MGSGKHHAVSSNPAISGPNDTGPQNIQDANMLTRNFSFEIHCLLCHFTRPLHKEEYFVGKINLHDKMESSLNWHDVRCGPKADDDHFQ